MSDRCFKNCVPSLSRANEYSRVFLSYHSHDLHSFITVASVLIYSIELRKLQCYLAIYQSALPVPKSVNRKPKIEQTYSYQKIAKKISKRNFLYIDNYPV